MKKENLINKVKKLPQNPGVYLFEDNRGGVLYVGKAKDLRSRVGSYFQTKVDVDTKTYELVRRINDVSHIEVASELEALLLEAELIKKYEPKYNILLKDGKSYIYIVLRNTKLPLVATARKPDLAKDDIVFGPYPDSSTTKYVLRTIRKFFPFRDCSKAKFVRYQKLSRPCLFGHIGVCQAPCVGNISVADYKKDIKRIEKFLSGVSTPKIIKDLEKKMQVASKNQDYEKAAKYRDMLGKFQYVVKSFRMPQQYMENPYLVSDLRAKALDELIDTLPILKELPARIECFDIANISGKEAVGSMVVAINGEIKKSDYKKFRIRLKNTPDDFGMMAEVLKRRLKHGDWPSPQLLVLDGGKGQLSAVLSVMEELDLYVPVIGLAKRFETVVYKEDEHFAELRLPRDNEGLKLLVRLRDEAHRFAQSYHHQLRLRQVA